MGRYVLTLCNGRIKDGPTPVKAPHTRRRLTTLFLRPTLARTAARSRSPVSPSRPISLSLSLSLADARPSPTTAVSLPLALSSSPSARCLYLPRVDSPRDSPTVHSLARSLSSSANTHSLSLSLILRPPPQGTLSRLSLFLVLPYPPPSRPAIPRSRVRPFLFLSSSLSLTNSLTLYKQSRVHTRACMRGGMCGGSSCARARAFCTRVRTRVATTVPPFFFFFSFFHRFTERHTRGGPPDFFSFSIPSPSPLSYLSLSHAGSRYAHRNCVR